MSFRVAVCLAVILSARLSAAAQCKATPEIGPGNAPGTGCYLSILQFKFAKENETQIAEITAQIKGLKGVTNAQVDPIGFTVDVSFQGHCSLLPDVEAVFQKAKVPTFSLNHTMMTVTLLPKLGFTGDELKKALATVAGVQGTDLTKQGTAVLHVDIRLVTPERLNEAASTAKCELGFNQTHEFVTYKMVKGKAIDYLAAIRNLPGVLATVTLKDKVIGVWINRRSFMKPLKPGERGLGMVDYSPLETFEGIEVEQVE